MDVDIQTKVEQEEWRLYRFDSNLRTLTLFINKEQKYNPDELLYDYLRNTQCILCSDYNNYLTADYIILGKVQSTDGSIDMIKPIHFFVR